MGMMESSDILVRVEGKAGRITLNRPKALNALNYEMVKAIGKALEDWHDNPDVTLLVIDGAGERAFCAGGDIADMYHEGLQGEFKNAAAFWLDEYRMNAYIAEYPKPYAAMMHGFVMGGGVGVSSHGSHRIVTDSSVVAMPECGIGLIPDVGGTHLLGRAPGHLGEFIGLTGFRMKAGDAIHAGFADDYVPSDMFGVVAQALIANGEIDAIQDYAKTPDGATLAGLADEIDAVFSKETVAEIMEALRKDDARWAVSALQAMEKAAPLSLILTLELVRNARQRDDLREALKHEFYVTSKCAEHGEFLEGVRAAIIDKDRNPKWRYPTLDDVPDDLIEKMLAPVDGV